MLHCKQYEAAMSSSKQTIPLICVTLLVLTHTASAQNSPDDYVKGHNAARSAVGVGPVAWNDTVAAYAKNYANQRAGDCSLTLSNGPYGENLFEGSAGKNWTAQDAIGLWVAGKDYYDHGNNTCASGKENECLVYEQVVWAKSTGIGCARVVCQNGAGVFINCNYYPAGNVIGERPY